VSKSAVGGLREVISRSSWLYYMLAIVFSVQALGLESHYRNMDICWPPVRSRSCILPAFVFG
jgi:hypothetical protein